MSNRTSEAKLPLRIVLAVAVAALASCGRSSSTPADQPSLSYPTAPAFTVGKAIQPLTPVSHLVTSYSASPALPAGLSLNGTTGVISGTPTQVATSRAYVITGSGSSGAATTTLGLVVNDTAPVVSYGSEKYGLMVGLPVVPIAPPNPAPAAGTALSWSISPALPSGLGFDSTSGVISGTATAISPTTTYTVTATNTGGSASASIAIAVSPHVVVLDTGLVGPTDTLRFDGSRVMAHDGAGNWVLKDFASGSTLARGSGACPLPPVTCQAYVNAVDLAGPTALVRSSAGFRTIAAADGTSERSIAGAFSWVSLSSDGSYVVAGNANALTIWSPSGTTSISVPGNYASALVSAVPGAVLVAQGPHAGYIDVLSPTTGALSTSFTYAGRFYNWFLDGSAFGTAEGTTGRAYSSSGVLLDTVPFTHFSGMGNWLWVTNSVTTSIYRLGSSATATYTGQFNPVTAARSGAEIVLFGFGPGGLESFDMSTGSAVVASCSLPPNFKVRGPFSATDYGIPPIVSAASPAAWVTGDDNGLVYDGASPVAAPRFLTHGAVQSVTGGTQYFSVATSDGNIYTYDSKSNSPVGTINFASRWLFGSATGEEFVAEEIVNASGSDGLRTYSAATGSLSYAFPAPLPGYSSIPVQISSLGNAMLLWGGQAYGISCGGAVVVQAIGGAAIGCIVGDYTDATLSPDGTRVAAANHIGIDPGSMDASGRILASVYESGALTHQVVGFPLAWISNEVLLVGEYSCRTYRPGGCGEFNTQGADLVDSTGAVIRHIPLPYRYLGPLQVVDTRTIFDPNASLLYSLDSGTLTWTNGHTAESSWQLGAVADQEIVFPFGTEVLAEPQ